MGRPANKERGEVTIRLRTPDGPARDFALRPSFEALQEIESRLGNIWPLVRRIHEQQDVGAVQLAVIVTAGMRAAGAPAELPLVGDMLVRTGLTSAAVQEPVLEFLTNALTGGQPPGEAPAAKAG